jgi:hypothetical protein
MTVVRDIFADGLILSAAQLQSLSDGPRARSERHGARVHRPGIATGLTLTSEPVQGDGYFRVFLEPGLAIDGHGRELLVTERVELSAGRFRLTIGNSVAEDTDYPVFIVSQYFRLASQSGPGGACGHGSAAEQVEERVAVQFGQPGDETLEQPAPPLSANPSPGEGSTDWPVFVGFVRWVQAADGFAEITNEIKARAAKIRAAIGINAATVAGDGALVQIQPKGALLAGDTVLQVSQTADGPELSFGTFVGAGRPIEPLLKVSSKGDVIAKGALSGKQTGNSVQMISGTASDGTILPLPAGVPAGSVANGDATLHIHVSPHIDPADAPFDPAVPDREFAALVQECRVDADRRVHCRIVWASLPLGPTPEAVGTTLSAGPGAVDFVIAAATTETSS